jgi:nucleoside-diphosphate-sugar epimerase
MRILIIGATGYLGSAVAEALAARGHEIVALTRPGKQTQYENRTGDMTDPASLTAAVTPDIDAVVNVASPTGDQAVDLAAIDALIAPLRGTGRAFVYTSGIWVLGATGDAVADENSQTNPIPIVGFRPVVEQRVLAAASENVRASVIRPGIVYGRGGGIPAMLVDLARKNGAPQVVADASVRWPMVHVDDLGDLYDRVIEQGSGGAVWHAVSESAVPVRDLAAAAGEAAGVSGEPQVLPLEQARAQFGALFADALALDQAVSSDKTHEQLGWQGQNPDAVTELRSGSYK